MIGFSRHRARNVRNPTLRQWPRSFCSTQAPRLRLAYDVYQSLKEQDKASEGAPILFIHGLFGSKKNNRSMSKVLARALNRRVFAIDLRNHGESPHDIQHDYHVLAQDVAEFIRERELPACTIIGHSMGAKTAMTLALDKPHLVQNLISVDNAPVDAALKSDFGKYLQGMREVEDTRVQKQSEADEILRTFEDSLPIRQFLLTNLIRTSDEKGTYQKFRIPLRTLASALDKMADFPFKDPESTRYNGPTLFVRGTRSRYVADDTLPVIGSFFPLFELRDIDAGHWVISENPTEFGRVAIEFLEQHP